MTRRLLLGLLIAWGTLAQNPPEIATEEAPASFSSRVNLMSVPVVVRDSQGRAVGGLKVEDFQLFDKGKSQAITRFSVETSGGESQRAADANESARFVAYLFDDVNMNEDVLQQARNAALHHLDTTPDPGTRIGVFTMSGQTRQDFTTDLDKVRAAINRLQIWEQRGSESCPNVSPETANLLDQMEPANNQIYASVLAAAAACLGTNDSNVLVPAVHLAIQNAIIVGNRTVLSSFTAIAVLARAMSLLPGSRTIVMVSPGFVLPSDLRVYLNDLFDRTVRARVTINALDIRGRFLSDTMDAHLSSAVLGEFANATGGTFFHSDNGLDQGLALLSERPRYVYILSFSPNDLKFDGTYHALKVKLKKPGNTTIQARLGYWAPKQATDPAEEAREDIKDAVFSADEIPNIPLQVRTEFFKQDDYRAELTVDTRVNVSGLRFRKAGDRSQDIVTVVTGLFDDNGHYVKGSQRTMNLRLRDPTLASIRTSGLNVSEKFDLPPGRYSVRVVARDSEGRSLGARNTGVEIP